jgi:hypothetical protein
VIAIFNLSLHPSTSSHFARAVVVLTNERLENANLLQALYAQDGPVSAPRQGQQALVQLLLTMPRKSMDIQIARIR